MYDDLKLNPISWYLNNSVFNGINLVASKDIKPGDEITTSYGSNYWFKHSEATGTSRRKQIKSQMKK